MYVSDSAILWKQFHEYISLCNSVEEELEVVRTFTELSKGEFNMCGENKCCKSKEVEKVDYKAVVAWIYRELRFIEESINCTKSELSELEIRKIALEDALSQSSKEPI